MSAEGNAAEETNVGISGQMGRLVRVAVVAGLAVAASWSGSGGASAPAPNRAARPTPEFSRGAPTPNRVFTVRQPGGARIKVIPSGDALRPSYRTPQGNAVLRGRDGVWRYAKGRNAAGQLVASTAVVGRDRAPAASRNLRPSRDSKRVNTAADGGAGSVAAPAVGTQRLLVLMVQFSDVKGSTTQASWAARAFGSSSSIAHYYRTASYGRLALTAVPDGDALGSNGVVGWMTLPRVHPNFQGNFGSSSSQLAADAIRAANPYVNFASFDTNGDGSVTNAELHVMVVVAGYDTSYGGTAASCSKSVWAHRGGTGSATPVVDGKYVGGWGYTMFGERHCALGQPASHQATIGVMVHELGHDIGLPDLYDLDGSSTGVGEFSVMAGGSWNRVGTNYLGTTPALPDAFSRTYLGWSSALAVPQAWMNRAITSANASSLVYRLRDNPGGVDWKFMSRSGSGQYFLVENRQKVGYDAGLPGCGLLIWHIDETRTSSNFTNATDIRRLVDLEEADGLNQLNTPTNRGDAGDPWPGSSGRVLFSANTNPSSRLYGGAFSSATVRARTGCATTMYADLAFVLNDLFVNARTLTPSRTVQVVSSANYYATKEAGEPNHGATTGGHSVWFKWTAPASGHLRLSTTGSSFDTVVAAYTGSSVGGLTLRGQNDNASTSTTASYVQIPVVAGVTYRIAVDGKPGTAGVITLRHVLVP